MQDLLQIEGREYNFLKEAFVKQLKTIKIKHTKKSTHTYKEAQWRK